MAEYGAVKSGKLNLKKGHSEQKKKKKRKADRDEALEPWMKEPGAIRHGVSMHFILNFHLFVSGNWRRVRNIDELKDRAVIEMYNGGYLNALVDTINIHVKSHLPLNFNRTRDISVSTR